VCDTKKFLDKSASLKLTKREAKIKLNLDTKFVVSFIGTLDLVKRPALIIELARTLRNENIHFLIIGEGPLRKQLQDEVHKSDLTNVTITGRISDAISLYYRATDLTILPGRGGIVISESMCFSTPVIAYQADGTELDLVLNNDTGVILPSGDIDLFSKCIKALSGDLDRCEQMGINAKHLILSKMNTANMASTVLQAVNPHI
jgi:glycosyltransferase involved in cell wall biosynthesis